MSLDSVAPLASSREVTDPGHLDAGHLDRASETTLRDFMTQQPGGMTAVSRTPEAQARLLASPSALGDKVLQSLESVHQNMEEMKGLEVGGSTEKSWVSVTEALPGAPGPAAQNLGATGAGESASGATGALAGLDGFMNLDKMKAMLESVQMLNDRNLELNFVARSVGNSTHSVNTLLRGQ
ncbi:MAG: hypothetical protein MI785_04335 [Kiloniellales bacterium]|nr:hypothetical protein [Kiloniellales bacterium]